MPNQPKTPNLVFRCPTPTREALEQIARERGMKLSDLMRLISEEYVDRWRHGG